MKSIKKLYRIGNGPSSSNTMGPKNAATLFTVKHPKAKRYVVTLYGSLAATGKGHLTDQAILNVMEPIAPTTIEWLPSIFLPFHPNAMKFEAYDANDALLESQTIYSVGGGSLSDGEKTIGSSDDEGQTIYPMSTMTDVMRWCERTGKSYWEYVEECEGEDIWDYLEKVWEAMRSAVERGLDNEGDPPRSAEPAPKGLQLPHQGEGTQRLTEVEGLVFAYALAVAKRTPREV